MIRSEFRANPSATFLYDATGQLKVKFNVDHLFKLPHTSKSLVFFPYHIDVEQIDEFNKFCKSNKYRIQFIGGENPYGGKSVFTNGTLCIMLIHESDDGNSNFLDNLNMLQEYT